MKAINIEKVKIVTRKFTHRDGEFYYYIHPNIFGLTLPGEKFDFLQSIISDNTDLAGENGIHEIIAGIKNVKITKEEYEKRLQREKDMGIEAMREKDIDYEQMSFLVDAPENFTKEQLSQTYYSWSGEEIGYAHSYSDITICFDYFSDKVEYYKTSEVLEVLEKWKKALERWNNPKEKKKMIEEYEKKKKEEGFL